MPSDASQAETTNDEDSLGISPHPVNYCTLLGQGRILDGFHTGRVIKVTQTRPGNLRWITILYLEMKMLRLPSHTFPSCRSFFYELLIAPFASSLFVPPHLFPTMAAGHLLQLISLEPLHPCSLNQVHFLDPPTPSLLRCTCSNVRHVYQIRTFS